MALRKEVRRVKMDVFDGIKHTLRKIEGIFEVILLTLVYYFIWQYAYGTNASFLYFNTNICRSALMRYFYYSCFITQTVSNTDILS